MGNNDSLDFFESVSGNLADVEVSKLAFNITGGGNDGLTLTGVGQAGLMLVDSNLFMGSLVTTLRTYPYVLQGVAIGMWLHDHRD